MLQIWSNEIILERMLQQIPQGRLETSVELSQTDINYPSGTNGRLGEPDDCAGAVSFLCSDDASYITGETIVMSGGMQSRL